MMKQARPVTKTEKIKFPIGITVMIDLLLPPIAPLITMLMLGNPLKELSSIEIPDTKIHNANRAAKAALTDIKTEE
ncbi:sodium ion-translocating decarboxylase subunit beta [Thermoanaerobacterium thermosaccharolyticum]|uniref:Na+-transporting methylmalonyl-CoA/oxaloacetate decarboxylase, beta subunit n=2 Tax=Thermoanaerobacterium thermosaccharolyticum TaxID=1517 RepID=L0II22_THETR|nr:sodium ion-translocating decarboxylase subunit beta [Thermoanaerobacterium thermosaccharolyticum]AGB18488.1 Na+-transporting methylmalonyl-CoA/oxaloacetate decarboxylase, beta subunit [Thermoanaerobacterium thermosaccharolyticum M0795]MCP2240877.1 oxaloacetate decarboxylase beta subunit [Thermoanaerobacterium thermosaccharolyticum]TCW40300.1 oxaloacetate decarboxylase beta subunit [Thermohydrogenium kirishiense]